jgi:hypothetical protein
VRALNARPRRSNITTGSRPKTACSRIRCCWRSAAGLSRRHCRPRRCRRVARRRSRRRSCCRRRARRRRLCRCRPRRSCCPSSASPRRRCGAAAAHHAPRTGGAGPAVHPAGAGPPAGSAPGSAAYAAPGGARPLPASLPPFAPLPAQPAASQTPPPAASNVSADTALMVNALLERPRPARVERGRGDRAGLAEEARPEGRRPVRSQNGAHRCRGVRHRADHPVWPKGSQKAKALAGLPRRAHRDREQHVGPTRAASCACQPKREQAQGFGPKRGAAPALPGDLIKSNSQRSPNHGRGRTDPAARVGVASRRRRHRRWSRRAVLDRD